MWKSSIYMGRPNNSGPKTVRHPSACLKAYPVVGWGGWSRDNIRGWRLYTNLYNGMTVPQFYESSNQTTMADVSRSEIRNSSVPTCMSSSFTIYIEINQSDKQNSSAPASISSSFTMYWSFISYLLEVVLDRITHISIAPHNLGNSYPDWQYQNDIYMISFWRFICFWGRSWSFWIVI